MSPTRGRWKAFYVGPDRHRHTAGLTFSNQVRAQGWLANELGRGLTLVLGHAESSICWGSEMIEIMARKNYSEEFRRRAVDLYESTPGATVRGIAEDLGNVPRTMPRSSAMPRTVAPGVDSYKSTA